MADTMVKTPVQIIQEILALCTTRKELIDAMGNAIDTAGIAADNQWAIQQLLEQLSYSGDGVSPSVDRSSEYLHQADELRQQLSDPDRSANGREAAFKKLEDLFHRQVQSIRDNSRELPEDIATIINRLAQG